MLLFNDCKGAENWLSHLVSYLLSIKVISIPEFCSVLDFFFVMHDWYILLLVKIVQALLLVRMRTK